MWCIVIRDACGGYHRETCEFKPDTSDLTYWEDFYSEHLDAYSSFKTVATVINIFEVGE